MSFVKMYFRSRLRVIISAVAAVLVFAASFALYSISLGAVLYPALLCALIALAFTASDIALAYGKHKRLMSLSRIPSALLDELPTAERFPDGGYIGVIKALRDEHNRVMDAADVQLNEMTDYYTVWAHQIKTPISSMRLYLDGEDSTLSRRLTSELFRVEQYVDMALMFLRLDSESTDYVFAATELDPVVRGAIKKFSGEFIARGLRLVYEPVSLRVVTDEKWLSFVIEQVLSNALKYTERGSITVRLDGETLLISDTGAGIAPEDLPRIFERGYTGYRGRQDKRASGIGLYLCRRVCNNLGITISAESVLDLGTTLRLDFSERVQK